MVYISVSRESNCWHKLVKVGRFEVLNIERANDGSRLQFLTKLRKPLIKQPTQSLIRLPFNLKLYKKCYLKNEKYTLKRTIQIIAFKSSSSHDLNTNKPQRRELSIRLQNGNRRTEVWYKYYHNSRKQKVTIRYRNTSHYLFTSSFDAYISPESSHQ